MMEVFNDITAWYLGHINYFTITILMAVESSFIPFPSEIVVPPAGYKAAQGELNLLLVIFFSTLGALIGAFFNYFLALWIGRAAIYSLAESKLAHFLLIEEGSIEKAEKYFIRHGKLSTLIGRLVPVIRQLISIPAGLAKMNLIQFLLYTSIGAFLWNIILALLGYYTPPVLVQKYYNEVSYLMLFLGIGFLLYLIYKGITSKRKRNN